jgi:Ca2+:H+ antiporter
MNWLLIFVPVAVALDRLGASPPLVFFAAALAIVPIAAWIVRATEQLATYTGDAVGGLLNSTFGNGPEVIIGSATGNPTGSRACSSSSCTP